MPDITTEIEKLAHSRPMEKTGASAELVDAAVAIAAELGFELEDAETGGGSDANTTAAAGVPSLDGLGPIGGNDHTPLEYIEKSSVVPRTTLLAALLLSVGGWTYVLDGRFRCPGQLAGEDDALDVHRESPRRPGSRPGGR